MKVSLKPWNSLLFRSSIPKNAEKISTFQRISSFKGTNKTPLLPSVWFTCEGFFFFIPFSPPLQASPNQWSVFFNQQHVLLKMVWKTNWPIWSLNPAFDLGNLITNNQPQYVLKLFKKFVSHFYKLLL